MGPGMNTTPSDMLLLDALNDSPDVFQSEEEKCEAKLHIAPLRLQKRSSIPIFEDHLQNLEIHSQRNEILLEEALANADSHTLIVETPQLQHVEQVEQLPKRRCLALISHNNMKPAMQEFVIDNKEILRHFRLTGTNSTMTMLGQVFQGMDIEYGPTMSSGPIGGDAQVAALLTRGDLGGMIFFTDPLSAHPHIADIQSLIRLANVHDILYTCNRTSAQAMIRILKAGLKDPTMIPSFYETLESPSVAKYREEQKALVEMLKQRQIEIEIEKEETRSTINALSRSSSKIVQSEDESDSELNLNPPDRSEHSVVGSSKKKLSFQVWKRLKQVWKTSDPVRPRALSGSRALAGY